MLIPVVAECDDGFLNDNRAFGVTQDDVVAALDAASRVVELGGETFIVGVLLFTNYGARGQLQILGVPLGAEIGDLMPVRHHEGSCIGVLATDLPAHPLQLQRLVRRMHLGIARTGSVGNDGSGEIFLGFSTATRVPRSTETMDGRDGHVLHALPLEQTLELLRLP